jgi:hypothetical protein
MFTNFNCNNSLQKQIMLENGDGYCINNINLQDWVNINQTILFKSYTLIFINLFSSGNYVKSINRKNEFKNSNYFIYNSINFFNFKKNLNKYKLIDFFKNSEKISNLNSLNLTKKKINFGKLT